MISPDEAPVELEGEHLAAEFLLMCEIQAEIDGILSKPWEHKEDSRQFVLPKKIDSSDYGRINKQIVMSYRRLGWVCKPTNYSNEIIFYHPKHRLGFLAKLIPYWMLCLCTADPSIFLE